MDASQPSERKRRVIVLRHGERVDLTFGENWTKKSFNESGKYLKTDLNMPKSLPERESFKDWENDSPLTNLGNFQASLVGSSLKSNGINFTQVFVSPSYRCLQTATAVVEAMESKVQLNIDYGLFEWVNLYKAGMPKFLTEEQRALIFNVNRNYEPIMSKSELLSIKRESFLDEFYDRNSRVTREILSRVEGDVLIVGHASNLDTCTRQLVGKGHRTESKDDVWKIILSIPYLASIAMEQVDDSLYRLVEPPCLRLTHKSCSKFDWRSLDDVHCKI